MSVITKLVSYYHAVIKEISSFLISENGNKSAVYEKLRAFHSVLENIFVANL